MVNIDVALNNFEHKHDIPVFRPNSSIEGSVTVIANGDVKCRHLFVRLGWYTEGRGSKYSKKVAEVDVFQGTLRNKFSKTYDFQFTLPKQPWSYQGHYVSIVWELQVQIDVPRSIDPKRTVPFILAPVRELPLGQEQPVRRR